MNPSPQLEDLNQKVHQLIAVMDQLQANNQQLHDQLNELKKRPKDNNMETVKREIIRTKIQSMLSLLEEI